MYDRWPRGEPGDTARRLGVEYLSSFPDQSADVLIYFIPSGGGGAYGGDPDVITQWIEDVLSSDSYLDVTEKLLKRKADERHVFLLADQRDLVCPAAGTRPARPSTSRSCPTVASRHHTRMGGGSVQSCARFRCALGRPGLVSGSSASTNGRRLVAPPSLALLRSLPQGLVVGEALLRVLGQVHITIRGCSVALASTEAVRTCRFPP